MTVWIPADRFLAVVDGSSHLTRDVLGEHAERKIRDLRNGRQEAISLEATDRIFTRLDLTDWFHLPKEIGGLADLYFGEDVFTPSWVPKKKAQLDATRSKRRKYRTEADRREAARLRQARCAAKRRSPCVDCGTPATGERCQSCRVKLVASPHGSISRYSRHGCRCDLCRIESTRYHRERRHRMKAAYVEAQAAA